jgi:hypothetical protein
MSNKIILLSVVICVLSFFTGYYTAGTSLKLTRDDYIFNVTKNDKGELIEEFINEQHHPVKIQLSYYATPYNRIKFINIYDDCLDQSPAKVKHAIAFDTSGHLRYINSYNSETIENQYRFCKSYRERYIFCTESDLEVPSE